MTVQIPLYGAKKAVVAHAVVDDDQADLVLPYHWRLSTGGYAHTSVGTRACHWGIYMHRLLLGLERGDKRVADHLNRDRLDNRLANLRIVTLGQSAQNVSGRSAYRGVTKAKAGGWYAQVKKDGKHIVLGRYDTELAAGVAAAHWRAANFPFAMEDQELLRRPVPAKSVRPPPPCCSRCPAPARSRSGLCKPHWAEDYRKANREEMILYLREYRRKQKLQRAT